MRRITLLATTATLLSLPVFAQTMPRAADPAVQEMQRERMSPRTPSVPQQNRLRDQADAEGVQRPMRWVREAREAVNAGRLGQANELIERAETRILTRGTYTAQADMPMQDPTLTRLNAARAAIQRQDPAARIDWKKVAEDHQLPLIQPGEQDPRTAPTDPPDRLPAGAKPPAAPAPAPSPGRGDPAGQRDPRDPA
jgi:hypothetical protein